MNILHLDRNTVFVLLYFLPVHHNPSYFLSKHIFSILLICHYSLDYAHLPLFWVSCSVILLEYIYINYHISLALFLNYQLALFIKLYNILQISTSSSVVLPFFHQCISIWLDSMTTWTDYDNIKRHGTHHLQNLIIFTPISCFETQKYLCCMWKNWHICCFIIVKDLYTQLKISNVVW